MPDIISERLGVPKPIQGSTLLERSSSLFPKFLQYEPNDIDALSSSSQKDLYQYIVEWDMRKGLDVSHEERAMDRYITGDTDSDLDESFFLDNAVNYIKNRIREEKKHYDKISGLAFYDVEVRNRIRHSIIKKRESVGGAIPVSVIVCDVNELHNVNKFYGWDIGDRLLATTGDGLKDNVSTSVYQDGSELYMGRMERTGDEFVIVIVNDEKGAGETLNKITSYQFPPINTGVIKDGKLVMVNSGMRAELSNSTEIDQELDPGQMLDLMIKQARDKVLKSGHNRDNAGK